VDFKNYINESLRDITGLELDLELINFILESFNFANQTHIYHLVTKNNSEHMAIEDFYDSIRLCIDSIAESSIGLGITTNENTYHSELVFSYNKENFINQVKNYRNLVSNLIESTNSKNIMAINDGFINTQQIIDKLLYKLQLS